MKLSSLLTLAALLGATGCVTTTTICGTEVEAASDLLNAALVANPQTPDAVGEPAVDIIIGIDAACQ